jgi:hypothetical protein
VSLRPLDPGEKTVAGTVVTVLSDCCRATVLVDSSAAGGHRCGECREECPAVTFEVREDLSDCCRATVTVAGRVRWYWTCSGCGRPCGLTS